MFLVDNGSIKSIKSPLGGLLILLILCSPAHFQLFLSKEIFEIHSYLKLSWIE